MVARVTPLGNDWPFPETGAGADCEDVRLIGETDDVLRRGTSYRTPEPTNSPEVVPNGDHGVGRMTHQAECVALNLGRQPVSIVFRRIEGNQRYLIPGIRDRYRDA